jgi:serine phosphatase RsbU (regulator of sigma subunit)/tetratricopeptide (TPR) repeat protein
MRVLLVIFIISYSLPKLTAQINSELYLITNYQKQIESFDTNSRKLIHEFEDSLALYNNISDYASIATWEFLIGISNIENNNEDIGFDYLLKSALNAQKASPVSELNSYILFNVGSFYEKRGLYNKAADYYKMASVAYPNQHNAEYFQILDRKAFCLTKDKKTKEALIVLEKLKTYHKIESDSLLAETLSRMSEIYKAMENYKNAIATDSELLSVCEKNKWKELSVVANNNLAYSYFKTENYQEALLYFNKSIQIGNQLYNISPTGPLYNMGICYQNLRNYTEALIQLEEAYKSSITNNEPLFTPVIQNTIAKTYLLQNDLYNARVHSERSIISALKSGNKNTLSECYLTYSEILKIGNDPILALDYFEKHLYLQDSIIRRQYEEQQSFNQKNLYYEQTEKNTKLNIANDELMNLEMSRLKIEAEKKEQQIELLQKEKDLEQLEKDKLEQNLKIAQQTIEANKQEAEIQKLTKDTILKAQQIKIKEAQKYSAQQKTLSLEKDKKYEQEMRKRITWLLALVGFIAILILGGLLTFRKKNKLLANQKNIIEEKNIDLEEKNEEITSQSKLIFDTNIKITDSINYARIIQSALLPDELIFNNYLTDSFVYFLPKDIVSGDFYWGANLDNKTIIVAADCTGHGVPGAFMSMLGTSFLNEITNNNSEITADELLNRMRYLVIKSLRQDQENSASKDGMDMAVCIYYPEKRVVDFAGANNPLYLVRDGELQKYSANRMPVGIHAKAGIPFERVKIPVKNNDMMYIFSDGFADQFGGPEGKKYKYKPFQNFILSIHNKDCSTQKQLLSEELDRWKGHEEQIDDILIVGFRV